MTLTGPQRQALYTALLGAFPDLEALRHWVRWGLDANLAVHARTDTLANAVFDLIATADKMGTLPALITAAIQAAPQDASLRAVATDLGLVVAVPLDAVSALPPLQPPLVLAPREAQHRQYLIARVRSTWVHGVLEQSVYAATRLELGLQTTPEVVANPWRFALEHPTRTAEILPPGTSIRQVYDRADGSLLILGAPGAGKTTLLLELARDLLDRAERDARAPLPVVLHLATWARHRLPLTEWLHAELQEKYQVPPPVGQAWLAGDALLLLLDGLDEVALPQRAACVRAINTFRQTHGLTPLVVCSREAEYQALALPLAIGQAVRVQPLTVAQVTDYLIQGGAALAAVRTIVASDPDLRALLDTPLMVNIVALAYHDIPLARLQQLDGPRTRPQILRAYVERMLSRRAPTRRYAPAPTRHWLGTLARQMLAHNQPVFYVEHLRPSWLAPADQRAYRLAAFGVFGVIVGLSGLVISWILTGRIIGISSGVLIGIGGGWLGSKLNIAPAETLVWSWTRIRRGAYKRVVGAVLAGALFGLLSGLASGLIDQVVNGLPIRVGAGLVIGSAFGLISGLIAGLFYGLSTGQVLDEQRTTPNQGIWQSVRHAGVAAGVGGLVGGVGGGVLVGLASTFIFGPDDSPLAGLTFGLIGSLVGILVGGLVGGGAASIAHLLVRLVLWRSGALPWKLVPFLDYATERILLRRVGGGYLFIHRLLLEYFARLESAKTATDGAADSSPSGEAAEAGRKGRSG
jgi:hypothetical protein